MFCFLFFGTVIISSSSYAIEASKTPSDTPRKGIILSFYEHLGAKNVEERVKSLEYFDSNYKDHDPFLAGGKESLRKVIEQNPIEANVKRIFLDGDYVIAHVHYLTHPGTHGQAGMDIFRFENDRIVERWNVLQAVPVKPVNTHDIF
jgi:predicted SnoaL-like aldol condensation-catalyzing enzyme